VSHLEARQLKENGCMSESNAARFNETIKKILELLVESCPVPRFVRADDLGMKPGKTGEHNQYFPSDDDRYLGVCLRWLADEGLIRGEPNHAITLAGLDLFDALPECLKRVN
jgi:hypothetical protein